MDPERLMAALSYMLALVIVPLLIGRGSPFVVFHAKQGLVVFVGFILSAVIAVWSGVLGSLLILVFLLASIAGMMMALQGKWWKMPLVSKVAEKFSI